MKIVVLEGSPNKHGSSNVHYLNLKNMGMVLGKGCGTSSMTQHSKYVKQAYELGKKLK